MSIYYFFAEKMFRKCFEYVSPPFVQFRTKYAMSLRAENRGPRGILLYPWEKSGTPRDTFVPVGKRNKQANNKQLTFTAIAWSKAQFMTCSQNKDLSQCDIAISQIRGPQKILCTFGEKEHTSKRVSIIACNNVISKVQCATRCPNQTLK